MHLVSSLFSNRFFAAKGEQRWRRGDERGAGGSCYGIVIPGAFKLRGDFFIVSTSPLCMLDKDIHDALRFSSAWLTEDHVAGYILTALWESLACGCSATGWTTTRVEPRHHST